MLFFPLGADLEFRLSSLFFPHPLSPKVSPLLKVAGGLQGSAPRLGLRAGPIAAGRPRYGRSCRRDAPDSCQTQHWVSTVRVGAEHRKPQYRRTVHTIVFSPDVAECRLGSGFPLSGCFLPPPQFPLASLSLSHTDPLRVWLHTESPNPELHPLWLCWGC